MATTTTSKQFALQLNDIWKGLLVAVLTPVITIIYTSLQAGTLTFDWKAIGMTALAAALAYLVKNFLTPAQIVVTDAKPATIEAVKAGDAQINVVDSKGATITTP